ncbi:UbiX family flavin prenyltransferase [Phenylobacterium sp.]|uniref:UbiX family flavin prenyltransferase n=1 Tax=Phenylobacterium sp. TaxID=1871053 RepID=UPI0008CB85FA|nr:UbiX family flavin prenyltransferase [Phenylobacterium sp.]MBA4795450.1 UbiX family flavin prenyltransferase [Phenylobacterium sp.]MBC7168451.1 UbiX family flavin prenyltransferase [Phenylobacterium sp.]OHB38436.1 MAG: 3-octaprenyl-4-hydroxybenzoate carboxy-lyase [Phenylobacterium sp. RIFCSPHIGHO2_01_FULL_70_10]
MSQIDRTPGERPRLVIGLTGASGVAYGLRALDACRDLGVESHLVISRSAALTLAQESGATVAEVNARADVAYRAGDVGAAIASGSFPTLGMLVAPCSVRTMSEIATGVTSSLLTRAADVTLKERRPLVLMVRETPLHLGHLRTMVKLAEMGAVIAPPLPAFYAKPLTIEEMIDQSVGRSLDLFGLSWRPVKRWGRDVGPIQGED